MGQIQHRRIGEQTLTPGTYFLQDVNTVYRADAQQISPEQIQIAF